MKLLPDITIVVTTWAPKGPIGESRAKSLYTALKSWVEHLKYEGQLHLHFADDGSTLEEYIPEDVIQLYSKWPVTFSRQERQGVGASLNAGFRAAYETSPVVAYFVDDWQLTADFDLTVWAEIIMRDPNIAMMRFGPPHPDISGTVRVFWDPHAWALELDRHHYAYSMRPALYHQRLTDVYGFWKEGVSSIDCETLYAQEFNRRVGPGVFYALPYPWDHVGDAEVGDITP